VKPDAVKLGDICEFFYGDGLIEAERTGGEFPVYGSNGIVGWHDKAITKGTTIIIGRKGSIGEVHYSEKPCWPIDTTYYVDLTKKPCNLRWLYYALLTLNLPQLNKSAAVPGLNRSDAYEKELIFPPLPEQQRIAARLDKADRLRRLRRYALELGATYLQSVFLEMFGDAFTNPKEWKIQALGRLLSIPPHIGTPQPSQEEGDQICVRVGEVGDWYVALDSCKRISLRGRDLKKYTLVPGDIVLARAIGSESHLGKLSVLGESDTPVVFDSHLMRLRPDNSAICTEFLAQWFRTDGGKARFWEQAHRTAVQFNINAEQISEIKIPLPPLALQEQFAGVVRKYDRLRVQQQESLRQAEMLFGALLERAFVA